MEIVKNKRQRLKSKKVKCKNCKSILRVTYTDLHKHWNTADILTGYYFSCPCCKQRVDLSLRKARRIV